ncbi:MAG: aquaporin [Actinomycetota bacterium]
MKDMRIFAAELFGTAVLLIGGPGTAVLATGAFGPSVGVLGVALAFGLALLVMAYAIGSVSGCHINPAVTLGLVLTRKTPMSKLPYYLGGQIIGAVLGGLVVWIIANDIDGFSADETNFAVNGWAQLSPGGFGFSAMAITEIVMTALLVFVVLTTTRKGFSAGQIGLTVGLTLTLIHLISIPVTNTSVNPVRSLGMAVFAGGDAIEQLWAFILFPLLGAVLGVLIWLAIEDESLEDTMLGDSPLVDVRDKAQAATEQLSDAASGVTDRLDR